MRRNAYSRKRLIPITLALMAQRLQMSQSTPTGVPNAPPDLGPAEQQQQSAATPHPDDPSASDLRQ